MENWALLERKSLNHLFSPYVHRSQQPATLFGSIFWKSTKCAKMMYFEHLRGAKWLEKCIVFEKKCLPGEERPEHRWNHCGMLPYQNSYRKMDKMAKFEAFWTSVRPKTKIQDNFFHELYTFCDLYTSTQLGMWVCKYRKQFLKTGNTRQHFFDIICKKK